MQHTCLTWRCSCSEVQNGAEELVGGAVRFVGKVMVVNRDYLNQAVKQLLVELASLVVAAAVVVVVVVVVSSSSSSSSSK